MRACLLTHAYNEGRKLADWNVVNSAINKTQNDASYLYLMCNFDVYRKVSRAESHLYIPFWYDPCSLCTLHIVHQTVYTAHDSLKIRCPVRQSCHRSCAQFNWILYWKNCFVCFYPQGLPLHIQIDTFEDHRDAQIFHRGYCQIKVFCDKVSIIFFSNFTIISSDVFIYVCLIYLSMCLRFWDVNLFGNANNYL